MAPVAVAAAIAMLFIILGVSEYMRLVITAAGIKDAMESAVVSVVNDNYNEVYHGVREGYAAGYEPDDTGFAASVDHGDIYGRMCFLLGLEEDGNSYVRYNPGTHALGVKLTGSHLPVLRFRSFEPIVLPGTGKSKRESIFFY